MYKVLIIFLNLIMINTSANQAQFNKAYLDKGADYKPRTSHFGPQGKAKYTNALILETSPYLLQHAHNPVSWHSWASTTLKKAFGQQKLIFLSIGYATCHWCHVMEEESFDDEEVAAALNADFISIKVDREVRPDVDEVFMSAVQILNDGRGGWPLNVILTPDGRAFFGGTYFTKTQLLSLLKQIKHHWQNNKHQLLAQADQLQQYLTKIQQSRAQQQILDKSLVEAAVGKILDDVDYLEGGLGQAPKFPQEPRLLLLLNQYLYQQDSKILKALNISLDAMAQGGFYDVVAGGFARYATDNSWLVPHFEKMLYNQAQLALVYAKAYKITNNPLYRRITQRTLDYVLREMQAKNSGFYSATDADSMGEEGTFFIWDLSEIKQVLGAKNYKDAEQLLDLSANTIFEDRHVIRYQQTLKPNDYQIADGINTKLYAVREKREKPLLDNKILLSWNALMAKTFLIAGQILKRDDYIETAKQNFEFLLSFEQQGKWQRVLLDKQYNTDALLEDYAFLTQLAIALYDYFEQKPYLEHAKKLMDTALDLFWDQEQFGFFNHQAKYLYIKTKNAQDGAILNANAVMFGQLIRLSQRLEDSKYELFAEQLVSAFSSQIKNESAHFYLPTMMVGLNEQLLGSRSAKQWAYGGNLLAYLHKISSTTTTINYRLSIKLAKNYHINSAKPLQKDLIATKILPANKYWQLNTIDYPKADRQVLGFSKEELSVYTGNVDINFSVKATQNAQTLPVIALMLQACNDKLCLAPTKLFLI